MIIADNRTDLIKVIKIKKGDDEILTMTPKQYEWLNHLIKERDYMSEQFHKYREQQEV